MSQPTIKNHSVGRITIILFARLELLSFFRASIFILLTLFLASILGCSSPQLLLFNSLHYSLPMHPIPVFSFLVRTQIVLVLT